MNRPQASIPVNGYAANEAKIVANESEVIADCIAWHCDKLRCPFYSARFYAPDKGLTMQGEQTTQQAAIRFVECKGLRHVYGGRWSKIVARKLKRDANRQRKAIGVARHRRLANVGYSANVLAMVKPTDVITRDIDAAPLLRRLKAWGVDLQPQTFGLGAKLAKLTPQTSDETKDVLPVWSLELFAKETKEGANDKAEQREQLRLERKASKARKTAGSGKSNLAKVYGGEPKYAALEAFQFGAVWALSNGVPVWTHSDVATREPIVNKLVWRRGWYDVVDAYRADYRALCKDAKRQSSLAFVRQLGIGMPDENELDSLLRQYISADLIELAKMLASGITHREAALTLGVSHTTVATRAKTIARQLLA